jgi:hypothetical protein
VRPVGAGQVAELELKNALARHDVAGGAAQITPV